MTDDPPDALPERVRRVVGEQTGFHPDIVQIDAYLVDDLGLVGDDAVDLLDAFAERFDVNLSELQFDRHFGPEGLSLRAGFVLFLVTTGLALLWMWAWWAWWVAVVIMAAALIFLDRRASTSDMLRVRHLVIAAEMGRWDEATMSLRPNR